MWEDARLVTRYVYDFDEPAPGGRELLGGKGIGLAEMTQLGIPVPAGFTITTDACRAYMAAGKRLPDGLEAEIDEHLRRLEERTGRRLGDPGDLLLVSVRSGAAVSMPGMMDTILNLGLNAEAASALDNRFGWDSYRRLIQMYGEVVEAIDPHRFDEGDGDPEQQAVRFRRVYEEETGRGFPQDAREQLVRAVEAVFESWETPRAQVYRRANGIPDDLGTAVNVVQMVFGNKGATSATGVCFTRDPSTGERGVYGEFLVDAQGEDVVAGIRTPEPLERMRELLPEAYEQLIETLDLLERHYRDMQDVEFTIENGKLWMLQTRSGKRTARAALKIAVDMAGEGLIDRDEAVRRVEPASLDQLLHPTLDPDAERDVIARGLPASPGAASGEIVFSADRAEALAREEKDVILVRLETSPEDIHGMVAARGILTARGGMTSHAAVVARGMGKPCVSGAGSLKIDHKAGTVSADGRSFRAGDIITIDGSTGEVMAGRVAMLQAEMSGDFATLMEWADAMRRMGVRANADTPGDARAVERERQLLAGDRRIRGIEHLGNGFRGDLLLDGLEVVAVIEDLHVEVARRPCGEKTEDVDRAPAIAGHQDVVRNADEQPPIEPHRVVATRSIDTVFEAAVDGNQTAFFGPLDFPRTGGCQPVIRLFLLIAVVDLLPEQAVVVADAVTVAGHAHAQEGGQAPKGPGEDARHRDRTR